MCDSDKLYGRGGREGLALSTPHPTPALYQDVSRNTPDSELNERILLHSNVPREDAPWNRFFRLARLLVRNLEVFAIGSNYGDPESKLPENISR